MAYDENGVWTDEPGGPPEPGGIGGPIVDFFKGLFGPGGQPQQDQPPPPPAPTSSGPDASSAADDAEVQQIMDDQRRKRAADIAEAEAAARIRQQQAADITDPELRAAKIEEAKAAAAKAQAELERIRSGLSPRDQAQFENDLAVARQRAQQQFEADQADKNRQFNADQTAAKNQFDASENAAQRAFTGQQNDLSRGVTLRGQEIERLKAQDDWVLGILRQQVAEGTLSLQRATNMFNAYVDRARLPSQIMESVSRAIQPFSASLPGKNYVAPGMEKGGPYDQLISAGGGDPSTTQRNPFKDLKGVDLFKLAKKAGADFKNTSIPDPGQVFGSVPIPQTNFNDYQSALAGFAPAQFSGAAGGAPPPPAAAPPQGPVASLGPEPAQMSDDQIARLNALLDGAQ